MLNVNVELPAPARVLGLNTGVVPAGSPLTANPTVSVNPFWAAMVSVYAALLPAPTLRLDGEALTVKSGGGVTVRFTLAVWLKVPLVAMIVTG